MYEFWYCQIISQFTIYFNYLKFVYKDLENQSINDYTSIYQDKNYNDREHSPYDSRHPNSFTIAILLKFYK